MPAPQSTGAVQLITSSTEAAARLLHNLSFMGLMYGFTHAHRLRREDSLQPQRRDSISRCQKDKNKHKRKFSVNESPSSILVLYAGKQSIITSTHPTLKKPTKKRLFCIDAHWPGFSRWKWEPTRWSWTFASLFCLLFRSTSFLATMRPEIWPTTFSFHFQCGSQ